MTETARQAGGSAPELADLAVSLARGAAGLVAEQWADHLASRLHVSAKSTLTDLVTAADRASERWLVEHILAVRPGDGILGEEGGERDGTSGVRWLLDPIDGTVNFVLGLPHYAVSVAAELHGSVVAGAVCNIATGELFHAAVGGGAYVDGQRLTGHRLMGHRLMGHRDVPLTRAVIGTGFAYAAATRARQAAVVAELLPQVADIRRMGSASLDLCAVAAGRLDGYFEAGLNVWDYAAGVLIASEAGCEAGGLRGLPASTELTVAARPELAGDLRALLERLGADRVSS